MKTHSNPLIPNQPQPNPVRQPVKPHQTQKNLTKPSQTHHNPFQPTKKNNKNPAKRNKIE